MIDLQLIALSDTTLLETFINNDMIVGAVGVLQFEVVVQRLKTEYKVDAIYEPISVATARWCSCDDERTLEKFKKKAGDYLALDGGNNLTYIAPTMVNLSLAQERNPDIAFHATREH